MRSRPPSSRAAAGPAARAGARSGSLRRAFQVPRSSARGVGLASPAARVLAPVESVGCACEKVAGRSGSAGPATVAAGDGGASPPGGCAGGVCCACAWVCARRACSSCTSSSSCSRNCRAMARARPTHRPTSATTRGSFSGPSTTSARTKMISTSEKRPSNRSHAPVALGLAALSVALAHLVELRVRLVGADLLLLCALLVLALVHRLLEPTHRRSEIRAHGPQLLGAEYDQHHEQDDQQLAHSYTHTSTLRLRPAVAAEKNRIIGQMRLPGGASSQNVTGPSLVRDTIMWAPNTPAETWGYTARALSTRSPKSRR